MRGGRASLLLLLLAAHFLTRWHVVQTMPLEARHFYPQDYLAAVRIAATHRLTGHLPENVWLHTPSASPLARAEAAPVRDFLALQRATLTPAEEREYLRLPGGWVDRETVARVLDIYLAALVWRVTGTSWAPLFFVYCVISTLACGMAFSIARQLTGSFWAGLCAAGFYLSSPLENESTVWSFRDASPLWFAVLALWCLVRFVTPSDRPRPAHFMLGVASAVGLGWRPDSLLLLPLMAGGVAGTFVGRPRKRRLLLALALFAAGVVVTRELIALAGPPRKIPEDAGFHVAYYGNWTRANLLGIENSFETARDDAQVDRTVRQYNGVRSRFRDVAFLDRAYSVLVRELYFETLRYNLYRLVMGYPECLWQALSGFSMRGQLEGQPLSVLARDRLAALTGLYDRVLDPMRRVVPALVVLGALAGLSLAARRYVALVLIVFVLYYAAILLFVLPETKHALPLVLPTSVFAAVALWSLGQWRRARGLMAGWRTSLDPRRARVLTAVLAATVAALLLTCAASALVSLRTRRGYLADILQMAASGVEARNARIASDSFATVANPGASGYLLTIADGRGVLTAWYLADAEGTSFLSHHVLEPRPLQYFYLTSPSRGVARCAVTLGGPGRIVSALQLDASRWPRPPFSTVFGRNDGIPGAPRLPSGVIASGFFDSETVDEEGIPFGDRWRSSPPNLAMSGGRGTDDAPLRLTAQDQGKGLPVEALRPLAGATIRASREAATLVSAPGQTSYSAEVTVVASQKGLYTFVIRYQALEGDIQLGVLTRDRTRWLAQAALERSDDASLQYCTVKLRRGEGAHLLIANAYPTAANRQSRVVIESIMGHVHPLPTR